MMLPRMSQVIALGTLLIGASVAPAAWAAPSRAALDAAAAAARLDFEKGGVVGSPDEVKEAWKEACDLGYTMGCRADEWHDEHGLPDVLKAGQAFYKRCSRTDPVACLVEGWAVEATPQPEGLTPDEQRERMIDRLVAASKLYRDGCVSLNAAACHELAVYSRKRAELGSGKQVRQFESGAEATFERYCRQDYQPSCVALGEMAAQAPEEMDQKGSAGWHYQQACDDDYVDGCYNMGLLLASQRSDAENRHWMDGLCDRGHTEACAWVARSHAASEDTADQALDAWKRACLLHSVEGCRQAGPALEDVRPAEAMQVHRMGCALGDGNACGRLGLMLLAQDEVEEAVGHLDAGCDAGVVDACVEVGLLRIEGRNVDADPRRALSNLERGCPEDGKRDAEACHAVGRLYEDGFGADKDRAIAARYYRYACDDGNVQSCYRVGESVTSLPRASQHAELLRWALSGYSQACDAGVEEGCLPAARLYAYGAVSVRDPEKAEALFRQQCENGHSLACREYGEWLVGGTESKNALADARDAFVRGRQLGDTESTRLLGKMYWYGQGGERRRGKARRLFREACKAGNAKACGGVEQPDR